MSRAAQRPASDLVAATLRARVPSGSLSHLSGKRLAAPATSISDEVQGVTVKKEGWAIRTMDYSLGPVTIRVPVSTNNKE